MTIRTVQLASGVLVQGELVRETPITGGFTGIVGTTATVRLPDGTERTGKLMPEYTDMTSEGDE